MIPVSRAIPRLRTKGTLLSAFRTKKNSRPILPQFYHVLKIIAINLRALGPIKCLL